MPGTKTPKSLAQNELKYPCSIFLLTKAMFLSIVDKKLAILDCSFLETGSSIFFDKKVL